MKLAQFNQKLGPSSKAREKNLLPNSIP